MKDGKMENYTLALILLLTLLQGVYCQQPCRPNPCQNGGQCTPDGNNYKCTCLPGYQGSNCEECGSLDMVLVIDMSSSIGEPGWNNYVVHFLEEVVTRMPVDNGNVRIGAVIYSSTAELYFRMNRYTTSYQISQKLRSLNYTHCDQPLCRGIRNTNTEAAIDLGCTLFYTGEGGRSDIKNAMLVLTDGKHNRGRHPEQAAARCRNSVDLKIFTFAVGNYYMPELRAIASTDPYIPDKYVITAPYYWSIRSKVPEIISLACESAVTRSCISNPCKNGGICTESNNNAYVCICAKGYRGVNCNDRVPPGSCEPNPCRNGGTCHKRGNDYACACRPGYEGRDCNECGALDLMIVIDMSSSIGARNWNNYVVSFLEDIVKSMPIDGGNVRVGAVIYSSTAQLLFRMSRYTTSLEIEEELQSLNYTHCRMPFCIGQRNTNTEAAIDLACSMFARGQGGRDGISNVMLVLTDGKHNIGSYPDEAADRCRKRMDLKIFAFAVGDYYLPELRGIATKDVRYPDKYVITAQFYGSIRRKVPEIIGLACESAVTKSCQSNPCQNNGICVEGLNGFECICGISYGGPMCKDAIPEPCNPSPCRNGGTCTRLEIDYVCACPRGYKGKNCEDNRYCDSNPCQNGGFCRDRFAGFTCTCRFGYSGQLCQNRIRVDGCVSNPCRNRGKCSAIGDHDYECSCLKGYQGRNCQECGLLDLVLVIDMSTSIGERAWETYVIPFLDDIVTVMPVNNGNVRIGAVLYASRASVLFTLDRYTTQREISQHLHTLNYTNCELPVCHGRRNTNSEAGIELACQMMTESQGDRPEINNAMLVITDGNHNIGFHPAEAADRCRAAKEVKVFAFAVGLFYMPELQAIANEDPTVPDKYIITAPYYRLIRRRVPEITQLACELAVTKSCQSNPCQNGATCSERNEGFTCKCQIGFNGPLCSNKCGDLDLVLVIDMSTSITGENWNYHVVPFFTAVVRAMPVDTGNVRIGAVLYASRTSVFFTLDRFTTKQEIVKQFDRLDYSNCALSVCQGNRYTNTEAGIDLGCSLFDSSLGDRDHISNAMLVITDGQHNVGNNPSVASDRCRSRKGVTIFAVGVSNYRKGELRAIANKDVDDRDKFVIVVRDFKGLAGQLPNIIGIACSLTDLTPCTSLPCQNGATCVDNGSDFICNCASGFTGNWCERVAKEPCSSLPCLNGATCENQGTGFKCKCQLGYAGNLCQNNLTVTTACSNDPCQNGGTCHAYGTIFTCSCPSGYSGNLCEDPIGPCARSPCLNGGTCTEEGTKFNCTCLPGYKGLLCQQDTAPCNSNPCQNGGTCFEEEDGYRCDCTGRYVGRLCEAECGNLNIVIVMDLPVAAYRAEWKQQVIPFLQVLLVEVPVNGDKIRISAVLFEPETGTVYEYKGFSSPKEVIEVFGKLDVDNCVLPLCRKGKYGPKEAIIDKGCSLFDKMEDERPGGRNVVIVITDGNYARGSPSNEAAERCRFQQEATICAVGVGIYNRQGLRGIADRDGDNPDKFVFVPDAVSEDELPRKLANVLDTTCPAESPCDEYACLNNGICLNTPTGPACRCFPGITGDHCQEQVDECLSHPCLAGGTCIDGINGYICKCPHGYSGETCEANVDECLSNPCVNGATCVDNINGYTCLCVNGFTGADCEAAVDFCERVTCENNGTCVQNANGHFCLCDKGYEGQFCETAASMDPCLSHPCQNGGWCLQISTLFVCLCRPGYTGQYCQDINPGHSSR